MLSQVELDPPASTVGVDVMEFIDQNSMKRHVFAEAHSRVDGHAMVTYGTLKLFRHIETGEDELFDRRDSGENAWACVDQCPDVREELEVGLEDLREVGQSGQSA